MASGTYTANLCVESNDPDEPFVIVPLEMTVLALQNIVVTPSSLSPGAVPRCDRHAAAHHLQHRRRAADVEPRSRCRSRRLPSAPMGSPKPVAPQANADTAPTSRAPIGTMALGDLLFEIDAEGATGNNLLLGVECAIGHYWVTGGDTGRRGGLLYKIDPTGALVATYAQAPPAPAGAAATWSSTAPTCTTAATTA